VIGDAFLRSFISIYDYENKQVGLALHKNSRATVSKLDQPEGSGMKAWVIVLIVLLVLAILGVVGYLVYRARKGKLAGGLD
jgi:uncharacterized membrane protein